MAKLSPLSFTVDVSKILTEANAHKNELRSDLESSFKKLALAADAKLKELAQKELGSGSRWTKFKNSMSFEELEKNFFCLTIDATGLWVEEGLPQNFDMKPGLLKNAKISKAGHKYKVIPFEHSRPPRQTNGYGQNLIDRVKAELKERKLPFKTLEKHPNGVPKLGKLHSFNVNNGDSEIPGKGNTPVLNGVTVYQRPNKVTGKVERGIFTFRTVTDSPDQQDKWKHPGIKAEKFLEQVQKWAEDAWNNEILPSILDKWR